MMPTNGSALSRPICSRSSYWKPSKGRLLPTCMFRRAPLIFPTTRKEKQMPDKTTNYAIVDDLSSRERPAGVLRRSYFESGGRRDEAFSQGLTWERTSLLVSYERGDLQYEFIEITEDEANQIVARIRAEVTGTSNA